MANHSRGQVWLRIIQINDVYELGNFPHFKALVDAHTETNHNPTDDAATNIPNKTLVILAGDFLAPSLLSSMDKGRGMVDCMNASGITHVCFGNHETDVSMKDLKQRIQESKFRWINSNMRELDEKIQVTTLSHDVVEISNGKDTRKVGLLGLLTEDPSVYRPGVFGGATIEPIIPVTQQYLTEVMDPLDLDLIIPLTHQRMDDDRNFMRIFQSKFPIILGGHDHEVYDETIHGSRVIKTGMDGENTAIHDIVWKEGSDNPEINVRIIPTNSYPADEGMKRRVEGHQRILDELNRAKIFRFTDWLKNGEADLPFTTKDNRLGRDNGTRVFASLLRMGMRADCGLMNAGNIRGGKTYPLDQEWFTWSDLKAEIPFSVGITAVMLPGSLIEDVINYSRSQAREDPPVTSGGYINTCDMIDFDEENRKIVSIRGIPFNPEQKYLTSFPANWFEGMDGHKPLLEWAKGTPYEHAKESSSKPCKEVIVEAFSALLWLEIGSFEELDTDNDGYIAREEVHAVACRIFGDDVADLVVDNVFSVADCDGDGKISPLDMIVVKFVAQDMHSHVCTEEEIEVLQQVAAETLGKHPTDAEVRKTLKILFDVLDENNDGRITRQETMQAIGEVRRRSLLM
ncbi:EF hand domain containing protein [Nitzschia inconspicua]|uniref:EF hand domain containing protein n=1 Tax=Nitzschia inconspicua TaxID=303405 RepID=A0A9K3KEM9_9STRA|nr:EF hand domain containing protein [Nitzschia inconspicua]